MKGFVNHSLFSLDRREKSRKFKIPRHSSISYMKCWSEKREKEQKGLRIANISYMKC